MNRLFAAALAVVALLLAPMASAFASPAPYINTPFDTPNATTNALIAYLNANYPAMAYNVACSGTTTATCTGIRTTVSVTGLTTAAGVTSATMTVTDTSVAAASQVDCFVSGYAGTGNPAPVQVVPAAGSFTFAVQNSHASAALNATVPVVCLVYN